MTEIVGLVVAAALINNIVLVQLLGVSAATHNSVSIETAVEIAFFSGLTLIISATANTLIYWFLLTPLNLTALNLIVFVSLCATLCSFLAQWVKEALPLSYRRHHIGLYLTGTNSAIVGISLQHSQLPLSLSNFIQSIATSTGTAIGFAFVIISFSALRLRLSTSDSPEAFRGPPIFFVSLGIAAMSLLGFAGLL